MIEIGGRLIGEGKPCFVIAEIGSNHNNDYDMALKLIDEASHAGVDAVKFQTFRADSHYSKKTPSFSYLNDKDTHALIQNLEIDRGWHKPLIEYAKSRNVIFLSSACDIDAINELSGLNMAAYKVASFDLPDIELIRSMAIHKKPMILSTGMASLMDIGRAIDSCHSVGNRNIILLQCTSLYPAPVELSNLSAMHLMKSEFGCEVGYSDHTLGDHVTLAAVALGACVVEKHFTLDRQLAGPDHSFAIEPNELKSMVDKIRDIQSSIGDGLKNGPRAEEGEMFVKGRRSIHAARKIMSGQVITADMLTVKRPGFGVEPYLINSIIGKVAKVDIEQDEWLTWQMI